MFNDIGTRVRVYLIVILFILGAIFAFISARLHYSNDSNWDWASSLLQNFATEAFGAALVVGVVDLSLSRIQKFENEKSEKLDILFRMGSKDLSITSEAVRIARMKSWLTDGSLKGVKLDWSNLAGINFDGADLRGANLGGANLQGAFFNGADLRGTSFGSADLQNAQFGGADLSGADLLNAKMGNAILGNVKFDETTTLPDGSKWSPESKFFATNPAS